MTEHLGDLGRYNDWIERQCALLDLVIEILNHIGDSAGECRISRNCGENIIRLDFKHFEIRCQVRRIVVRDRRRVSNVRAAGGYECHYVEREFIGDSLGRFSWETFIACIKDGDKEDRLAQ